ncbi:dienelactone hydrolase family protein [candidate division WOR-3 bacterium]|nr:dienelactone hydrolase family protein [candidate division WOR-3 bacterium]
MKIAGSLFMVCMCCIPLWGDEPMSAADLVSAGMTAYSQDKYIEAIQYFRKAAELRPENSSVVYNVACCYALENMSDSALVWLNKAIKLGVYKFNDDTDFESLSDNEEYQALVSECEAKIMELEKQEWLPVVSVPENYSSDTLYPLLIALHGFGSNPESFARALDSIVTNKGYIFCCPYGPEIRGTTAFGWGDDVVADPCIKGAYTYVKENYSVDTTKIILLGYSQGGYYSFMLGVQYPEVFSGVICVAGYYDDEFDEFVKDGLGTQTKFYMMIGELDRSFETNAHADSVFKAHGVKSHLVSYPELGHAFPADKGEVVKALEWMETIE